MDERIVTFGCLMGLEVESKQGAGADDDGKDVLLIYCPTGELGEDKLEVTTRMKDLAFMGFVPVAIARGNPEDMYDFAIFATADLSDSLRTAVLNDSMKVVIEALKSSEGENYERVENND